MEKITYILGAGFSAPAGLPLMNNFILKAKDIYYSDPVKYEYFLKIFNKVDDLSKIKNVFKADLYNIEEVLSIFETDSFLYRNTSFKNDFIQFISDVIEYYTFDDLNITFNNKIGNYHGFVLGEDPIKQVYASFLCSLLKIRIRRLETVNEVIFDLERIPQHDFKYSIITLNYDTILENCLDSILNRYKSILDFQLYTDKYDSEWTYPHLIKLHGCVKNKNIIPPTWAKNLSPQIEKMWRNAFNIIKDSTQLRIIGYSLPITDSNVRYLLKSAILKNNSLKKIDILCLDNQSNHNKNRYDEFIDFNYYDFINIDSFEYMSRIRNASLASRGGYKGVSFNMLEKIHQTIKSK
jgi:hypothetical protein